MSKTALDRLIELINEGLSNDVRGTGRGIWFEADFDEISTLSEICSDDLPKKFLSLANSKYPFGKSDQYQLALRLKRSIEVQNKFGSPETVSNDTALVPVFTLNSKDRARVLELCSDMRKIILASTDFDEPHKIHLLNRFA
ncbi:MAG: hypothetical protein ABF288_09290 [Octadecabacter sp.]